MDMYEEKQCKEKVSRILDRHKKDRAYTIQLISFRQGQDRQVIEWIKNNIGYISPFQQLLYKYDSTGHLKNDDPEAITMLFLTKEDVYRDFTERAKAIDFIYTRFFPKSVADFCNKYKVFYHLYQRAKANRDSTSNIDDYLERSFWELEMIGFNKTSQSNENVKAKNRYNELLDIKILASKQELKYNTEQAAITHLIKHGSKYNRNEKLTGNEINIYMLLKEYLRDANNMIKDTAGIYHDKTLGKDVFSFENSSEKALVSYVNENNCFISTYFPKED